MEDIVKDLFKITIYMTLIGISALCGLIYRSLHDKDNSGVNDGTGAISGQE